MKERRKGDGVAGPGVEGAVALAMSSHSCITALEAQVGWSTVKVQASCMSLASPI